VSVQCIDLAQVAGAGGVVWSVSPEGFHTNLVVLEAGGSIPAHRNDGLDVLIVVLAGSGVATVDDDAVALAAISALLVPRGAVRSVTAGRLGLRYLTVHAPRGPLTIGDAGDA
jgi:quercetin dioxygenase-like cupin family protein